MSGFTTPAIMLRRIEYGDYDLIITFFTRAKGKIAAIAKSAKKSVKRFRGILEPFSVLNVVCTQGRKAGLPVLQEASLTRPFPNIRLDMKKTGYASYWAELIYLWMEENHQQVEVFTLFQNILGRLDAPLCSADELSIMFQMRFVSLMGIEPNLNHCCSCKAGIEKLMQTQFAFDLKRGGVVCKNCRSTGRTGLVLSKGTIKQLLWAQNKDMIKAARVKFTSLTLEEGMQFMEAFVPYHLGKEPKSLGVLRQVRTP